MRSRRVTAIALVAAVAGCESPLPLPTASGTYILSAPGELGLEAATLDMQPSGNFHLRLQWSRSEVEETSGRWEVDLDPPIKRDCPVLRLRDFLLPTRSGASLRKVGGTTGGLICEYGSGRAIIEVGDGGGDRVQFVRRKPAS